MTEYKANDAEVEVFRAVMEMEKQFYTKQEIHDALLTAAEDIRPSEGFGNDG